MKRLVVLFMVPLMTSIVILGLSRGAAPAQAEIVPTAATPTPRPGTYPTAPQQINICAMSPEYRHGGDETLSLANFAMDLPPGDYFAGTITRAQTTTVELCYLPDGSTLRLSDYGVELSRTARSGDAQGVFDAIVASVRPPFDVWRGVRVPTLTTVAP